MIPCLRKVLAVPKMTDTNVKEGMPVNDDNRNDILNSVFGGQE